MAQKDLKENEKDLTTEEQDNIDAVPEEQAEPTSTETAADTQPINQASEKEAALQAELDKTKDTLLRTAAEYDNYRKRATKEKEAAFNNGMSHAIEKILIILDTLEMAANAPTQDEEYKKGVSLTLDKSLTAFHSLGICEIEALGKPFSPDLHAAVMQEPATEEFPSGTVIRVFQKGYQLNGRVIRHATVVVAE
ncbi:MAG: nucleotide exchange factor GrpE [Oscillospiraceae bacterium]|nr:nucleotide exchange factor GrpE [Oscillospiraceae bacterium]